MLRLDIVEHVENMKNVDYVKECVVERFLYKDLKTTTVEARYWMPLNEAIYPFRCTKMYYL